MEINYHQYIWRPKSHNVFSENFLLFQKCLQVKIIAVFSQKFHKIKKAVEEIRNHILGPIPTVETVY